MDCPNCTEECEREDYWVLCGTRISQGTSPMPGIDQCPIRAHENGGEENND